MSSKPGLLSQSRGDLALALVVLSVVALMVVPLPTFVLDILLAANFAASIAILLITVYVQNGLSISSFPTIILIATLVRLALNVSSTRLILLQADAGDVIRSFGEFVVRGDYVVGAILFAILVIIQFVVIAKGSERVAEVAARFTLDALPGKQMAIDAELRSGLIAAEDAEKRRRTLERESQFYGAMDGAMKFVKGDVIASVIITFINIGGGLAIGIGMHDMAATDALQLYGLLTIGDGLVSQLPALLLASSAGLLVTRVSSESSEGGLGDELSAQIFGVPKATLTAGVFVGLLGFIPGLPAVPFLLVGTSLALAGWRSSKSQEAALPLETDELEAAVAPWTLEFGTAVRPLVEGDLDSSLNSVIQQVRSKVQKSLGIHIPPCVVELCRDLPEADIQLSLREIPSGKLSLYLDDSRDEQLTQIQIALTELLTQRAGEFLTISETQRMLDRLERTSRATVRHVVPKPLTVVKLKSILNALIDEGISIRDLEAVLETLAELELAGRPAGAIAEEVRQGLKRPISYALTQDRESLQVLLLDPMIEEPIASAQSRDLDDPVLTLAPAATRDIVEAVRNSFQQWSASDQQPVLITRPDIRRSVRALLASALPSLRVIAPTELVPSLQLQTVATAAIGATDSQY